MRAYEQAQIAHAAPAAEHAAEGYAATLTQLERVAEVAWQGYQRIAANAGLRADHDSYVAEYIRVYRYTLDSAIGAANMQLRCGCLVAKSDAAIGAAAWCPDHGSSVVVRVGRAVVLPRLSPRV